MPAQPRFHGVFNIDRALLESQRVIEVWMLSRIHPDVPLYSGGLIDGWPNWALDGIGICKYEFGLLKAYLEAEQQKTKKAGSRHG